jgi:hypothetical protein
MIVMSILVNGTYLCPTQNAMLKLPLSCISLDVAMTFTLLIEHINEM